MNPLIKFIFYITSISSDPVSEVIVVQSDSVTFFNNSEYVTKAIIYRRDNVLVFERGYIHIGSGKIEKYFFGEKKRRKYRIRRVTDYEKIDITNKPIRL